MNCIVQAMYVNCHPKSFRRDYVTRACTALNQRVGLLVPRQEILMWDPIVLKEKF